MIDLDKTLYKPQTGIFEEINKNIKKFMIQHLNLQEQFVENLRVHYVKTYGSTLMGLIKNYNIDPYVFLDFAHSVDLSTINPNSIIKEKLRSIKGRKIIFTSAPKKHALNVLERLEILDEFNDIFDIIEADFIAKPNKEPYIKVTQKFPSRLYTMIDDMEQNLITAKLFKFKTILINKNKSTQVDLCVESFEEIPVELL
ncbi:Pyridoxal-5'-phosphate phosphatase Alphaproteobacterial type [Desulfurella amilsii]|uniref:Pyridoxal-5'-phosphate phosphatase Alphaproteobacterial type n=1 Tax=Desulfurella amilsii TaxID=1562698 RepID=A0A1X4XZP6_9BACT|nr:Pyridoxal-5'-phosphate phosphatase Alphaproteobacterial type [Desulfurella amilsii]